ncbi:hypothetical protein HAX54_015409 [Datura stramonium]|uniref:Uncharacterized protein n=1 Tax=Datura stramonium TaxID=4076 RepID=A0ABS8TPJ5_DATST|nr:hypothetical protein [Datura stramonium]
MEKRRNPQNINITDKSTRIFPEIELAFNFNRSGLLLLFIGRLREEEKGSFGRFSPLQGLFGAALLGLAVGEEDGERGGGMLVVVHGSDGGLRPEFVGGGEK